MTYIFTALVAIEKLWIYTGEVKSAEQFLSKKEGLISNACQLLLMTIGEEVRKVDPELKAIYPDIPWSKITRLRNRIAHDYRGVNPEISFYTINHSLTELKNALIGMLDRVDFPNDKLNEILESDYYALLSYLKK